MENFSHQICIPKKLKGKLQDDKFIFSFYTQLRIGKCEMPVGENMKHIGVSYSAGGVEVGAIPGYAVRQH